MTSRTGVLLVNLGTPLSQKPLDVKKYLIQFLTDERVIDLPWLQRQALVRAAIVPRRYKESAKSYASIWTDKGSPLLVHGIEVKNLLQQELGQAFQVELGMRYQHPSIESALQILKNSPKLIVIPLFPQYASATTGSVHQEVMRILSNWEIIPEIQLINSYPTHPKMIDAFCERAKGFDLESYDHNLLSFHGLPEKQLKKAGRKNYCLQVKDCCASLNEHNRLCYGAQCGATAQAIIKGLKLPSGSYTICYQSRLGKEPWIKPYFSDVLKDLSEKGIKKLLVFSPSFVCDCLETIDEIGSQYLTEFRALGGEVLDLVPGLNDHPLWIEALKSLTLGRSCSVLPHSASHDHEIAIQ